MHIIYGHNQIYDTYHYCIVAVLNTILCMDNVEIMLICCTTGSSCSYYSCLTLVQLLSSKTVK